MTNNTAALDTAALNPMGVKPLEWSEDGFNRADDYAVLSAAGQGPTPYMLVRGSRLVGNYESVEAAKAAAQADYEQRIRSALAPVTAKAVGGDLAELIARNKILADYIEDVSFDYAGHKRFTAASHLADVSAALAGTASRGGVGLDEFQGDDEHLLRCILALLDLDAKGSLAPHGIGHHARVLLSAAASRLAHPPKAAAGAPKSPRDWFVWLREQAGDSGSIPADRFAFIARFLHAALLQAPEGAREGMVLVPIEPDHKHLARLAALWGYTIEETADSYAAFLEALPAAPETEPRNG